MIDDSYTKYQCEREKNLNSIIGTKFNFSDHEDYLVPMIITLAVCYVPFIISIFMMLGYPYTIFVLAFVVGLILSFISFFVFEVIFDQEKISYKILYVLFHITIFICNFLYLY